MNTEKAMAPHSSTLAWKIPWMEEPGRLQSMGVARIARSRTRLSDFTFIFHFHALEKEMATHSSSCLENPRDGGAWWAAVSGVAQSRTRLKWLSSRDNKELYKIRIWLGRSEKLPVYIDIIPTMKCWGLTNWKILMWWEFSIYLY